MSLSTVYLPKIVWNRGWSALESPYKDSTPFIPIYPCTAIQGEETATVTCVSYERFAFQQHMDIYQHRYEPGHSPNAPSTPHFNQQHTSQQSSTAKFPTEIETPELTHKALGTQEYLEQQSITDSISSYALKGFRRFGLVDANNESLDPALLIPSSIFTNSTIDLDIRVLILINKVPLRFPDLPQQTPVLFRIIKALWPQQNYRKATKKLTFHVNVETCGIKYTWKIDHHRTVSPNA